MPGGGGGSSQPTSTESVTRTEMSPEQRQLYSLVIPEAEKFMKTPTKQWEGSAIAGFDPLQQAGQQMTIEAANSLMPQIKRSQDASNFLLKDALDINTNPYLRGATNAAIRPLNEQFERTVLPGIAGSAVTAGGYGDTRTGIAQGLAGSELTRKSGDITSQISSQAYQQAQDNMVKTLGLQPELNKMAVLPGMMTEAVGAQRRNLAQSQLSEQVQKFMNEQVMPFMKAQEVAALAQGIPGGTSATTGTSRTQQPETSPLQYLMGGLSLASLFAGSDERIKRDIRPFGSEKGIPLHEFRYLDSPVRFVGVLAQKIEKLRPDAVKNIRGVKFVNYHKLGIPLRLRSEYEAVFA